MKTLLIIDSPEKWSYWISRESKDQLLFFCVDDQFEHVIPENQCCTQQIVLRECGYDVTVQQFLIDELAHPLGFGFILARFIHHHLLCKKASLGRIIIDADPIWGYGILQRASLFFTQFNIPIDIRDHETTDPLRLWSLPEYWINVIRKEAIAMANNRPTQLSIPATPCPPTSFPVSGVVTCRNLGRFLPETINSVQQALQNGLLVVVDDGSDDPDTCQLIEQLSLQSEYQVICLNNRGVCAARNAGIAATSSPYILLWDGDDLIDPAFVENALEIMNTHPDIGAIYSWVHRFGEDNAVDIRWDFILPWGLCKNCGYALMLIRRTAFDECGGFDETMGNGFEDWEFLLRLTEHNWRCVTIPEMLSHYRIRNNSMLQKMNRRIRAEQMNKIMERHPRLYQQYHQEIIRLCQANTDYFQEHFNPGMRQASLAVDSLKATQAMTQAINTLNHQGCRNVMIFGAGKHSRKCASAFLSPTVTITAFIDDGYQADSFFGYPVIKAKKAATTPPEAVIISSDVRMQEIYLEALKIFTDKTRLVKLYGDHFIV